jgi:hypothetical protein
MRCRAWQGRGEGDRQGSPTVHFHLDAMCELRRPGFMVGGKAEAGGIAKDGAKMVMAVACAQVGYVHGYCDPPISHLHASACPLTLEQPLSWGVLQVLTIMQNSVS